MTHQNNLNNQSPFNALQINEVWLGIIVALNTSIFANILISLDFTFFNNILKWLKLSSFFVISLIASIISVIFIVTLVRIRVKVEDFLMKYNQATEDSFDRSEKREMEYSAKKNKSNVYFFSAIRLTILSVILIPFGNKNLQNAKTENITTETMQLNGKLNKIIEQNKAHSIESVTLLRQINQYQKESIKTDDLLQTGKDSDAKNLKPEKHLSKKKIGTNSANNNK